nr:MAG TPA: hypothetical protein [Caudoviricetes sp.]
MNRGGKINPIQVARIAPKYQRSEALRSSQSGATLR